MTEAETTTLIIILSALGVLMLLGAVAVGISYYTYSIVFKRRRDSYDPYYGLDKPEYAKHKEKLSELIERVSAEPCEIITITARDGIKLAARYYHRCDGAPIHVICHGYKSSPLRDGSGGGCDAFRLGHNLLLIYQRAHGLSEGKTITFGIKERYDIVDWVKYMTDRFGSESEIFLVGTSMGGASVLMASALGLPATVKCIIADCPYSAPKDIILSSAKAMGYPPRLIYPFIKLGALLFGGFNPDEATAKDAITRADAPILIAHGEADTVVPVKMAHELYESATRAGKICSLKTFPGSEHCLCFIENYDEYVAWRDAHLVKYFKNFC